MVNISLFSPPQGDYTSRAAELARQKKLADMLIEMSQQEMPVSTAGGITAPVSPYGALAKALTSFGGSYLSGRAEEGEKELQKQDREMVKTALENYYTQPDTKQLALSDVPAAPVNLGLDLPRLPGQGTSDQIVAAPLNLPGVSRAEVKTVPGRETTPQEQMQKLAQLLDGGETSRSMYNALMPQVMKRQEADIQERRDRTMPKYMAVGARGVVDVGPGSPTRGQIIGAPPPERPDLSPISRLLAERTALPPGDPRIPALDAAINLATTRAPGVNVNVGSEKPFSQALGTGAANILEASSAAARSAVQTLGTVKQIKEAINSGKATAGPGTTALQFFRQISGNDPQTLQATRATIQGLAQLTLNSRGKLKGQGTITDYETKLLERAVSGDIDNLSLPEIGTIVGVAERGAKNEIKINSENVNRARAIPGSGDIVNFYSVSEPSDALPAAQQPKAKIWRWNPEKGVME
jgi:hypothetical protein